MDRSVDYLLGARNEVEKERMSVSVFLSHTAADKSFVRKLAADLDSHGIRYWLDEAEIKVGESLIEKIRQGIDEVDYVAVILSPRSVVAPWVQRETDVAMNQEIQGKKVKVLPIMLERCELPGFLLGKLYADFTDKQRYAEAFRRLVESMGVVFNRTALEPGRPQIGVGQAVDSAVLANLPILPRPFHRPFQYIGSPVSEVKQSVGQQPNEVGNIVVDSDDCHMLLEAEGNFVSFVQVELMRTAPHLQSQEFDSIPVLGALSINPAELDLVRKQTHCHTYYDHRKKLKITVMCAYDGAPLSVGFSTLYYGM